MDNVRNSIVNGVHQQTRSNGVGKDSGNILEECIYVVDALEHDEFQVRASRVNSERGQLEYLVEWYKDMDLREMPYGCDICKKSFLSHESHLQHHNIMSTFQ